MKPYALLYGHIIERDIMSNCKTFKNLSAIAEGLSTAIPATAPYANIFGEMFKDIPDNLEDPETWEAIARIAKSLSAIPATAPYALMVSGVLDVVIMLLKAERDVK